MIKIKDVIQHLESLAPNLYQESYDNSGLIVGRASDEVKGVIICLDSTEDVVEEAIDKGCNLVIAHHPIVFKGMKRFNGKNYVERTVMKAIKHDIAIYAIHTNLDNVQQGVNAKIAERIGLENTRILAPKNKLLQVSAILPATDVEQVKKDLYHICQGEEVSFASLGALSEKLSTSAMIQWRMNFPLACQNEVSRFLRDKNYHFEITTSSLMDTTVGAGMIGELPNSMKTLPFLSHLKEVMNAGVVKYTQPHTKKIKRVAVCGGAGGFLLSTAIRQKADIFITSDYKYHEFFDAEGRIIIADIGHYESEQFTIQLLYEILKQKFTTFALLKTHINTNPVNYL